MTFLLCYHGSTFACIFFLIALLKDQHSAYSFTEQHSSLIRRKGLHFVNPIPFIAASLTKDCSLDENQYQDYCNSSLPYRIVKSFVVEKDTIQILPLLIERFFFSSPTQARKACRQGKIILLRNNETFPIDDDRQHENGSIYLQPSFFVNASILKNKIIIEIEQPFYSAKKDDIIACITRLPGINHYPVDATGYVTPPNGIKFPKIVYEDEDIAVVNKPEGVTTTAEPRQDLQSVLPFYLSPPPQPTLNKNEYNLKIPRPVHRLDRRTSGLVVVAKRKQSLRFLSQLFEKREVRKTYVALVFGKNIQEDEGCINYPILGKNAVTEWTVLERSTNYTLLELRPRTGRNHQIRRHLSYCLKSPIVGDNKYDNGKFKQYRELGLFLCCTSLTFAHPVTKQERTFSVPLPRKFCFLQNNDGSEQV